MGPAQLRNTAFLQKIIVRPCILSNLLWSSVQFIQLFCPCIYPFLKFENFQELSGAK